MIDGISDRLIDAQDHVTRAPYATSYRANAACVRELTRLHEAVADSLTVSGSAEGEAPVVRRSPARCLVQLGPVALTIAWLQGGQSTVAEGELLVVVWRGQVASRTPHGFERAGDRAGASRATSLWEEVRRVTADSEAAWGWAAGADQAVLSTPALADRCVARLREAYLEGRDGH